MPKGVRRLAVAALPGMVTSSTDLDLSVQERAVLRNLQAGFYELPPEHPVWQRLEKLGLVAMRQPPRAPIQLTPLGCQYHRD
jgi:hypothetical protein